jgi:GNAT superfamily N-acetyltransferase
VQPTIRDARVSDARRLEEIRLGGWKAAYGGMIDADYLAALTVTEERIATWRERIESPPTRAAYLAAEQDGDVVGFAVLLDSRDEDVPDAAELLALYVDPDLRSTGIGGRLLDAGFARMPQSLQILWTLEGNAPARAFYERRGFVLDGARKTLEVPGEPVEVRYHRTRLG